MLQGNFSQWPGPIYDPAVNSNRRQRNVPPATPFPGNIIPQSAFSAVTSKMLPFIPPARLPGLVEQRDCARWAARTATHGRTAYKIDHAFSEKHHLSGMYNSTDRPYIKSPAPSRLLPVGNTTAIENYNLQDVTTNIVRDQLRLDHQPHASEPRGLGFSRFRNPNFSLGYNQGWVQPNGGKLGLTGTQYDLFPTIQFSTQGYTRFGDDIASDNYFNTLTVLDNLTWVKGKHTIKIGRGSAGATATTTGISAAAAASFILQSLETGLPGVANSGNAFASFCWVRWTADLRTSALRCRAAATSISACTSTTLTR